MKHIENYITENEENIFAMFIFIDAINPTHNGHNYIYMKKIEKSLLWGSFIIILNLIYDFNRFLCCFFSRSLIVSH